LGKLRPVTVTPRGSHLPLVTHTIPIPVIPVNPAIPCIPCIPVNAPVGDKKLSIITHFFKTIGYWAHLGLPL